MNQSIVKALTTVSDALAAAVKPSQLAPVAARATAKALGCQTTVWLLVGEGGLGDESRWLTRLGRVPGVGQAVRTIADCGFLPWKNGSSPEGAQLRLAGTSNRWHRAWRRPFDKPFDRLRTGLRTERTTLAALTDGQVTTAAELAAAPARAVRVSGSDSRQDLNLVAGLFHAGEPMGLLSCTWAGTDENGPPSGPDGPVGRRPDLRELLVVCLANYLGQVLGGQQVLLPETDVYLAGTGLLLTALDVGSPAARECAEAVTLSALEMAVEKQLSATEAQTLQWAALFHEVGRAPMDRWLTFPVPDDAGSSVEPEEGDPPALSLIPGLQPAANLLTQAMPVLDGRDDDLGPDVCLPARLLAACLSGHCG